MSDIILRTIIPILLLIGTGLLSRKLGILKSGDERILSAYVYYFALPALFFVNMTETKFTGETLRFMLSGTIPILVVLTIYISLHLIFRFSKDILYLLVLSTIARDALPLIFPVDVSGQLVTITGLYAIFGSIIVISTLAIRERVDKKTGALSIVVYALSYALLFCCPLFT